MKTPTQTAHRAALLAHRESYRPAVLAPAPRSTLSPYAMRCALAAQDAKQAGFAGFAAALVAEAKTALPISKIASASFHDHLEKPEKHGLTYSTPSASLFPVR